MQLVEARHAALGRQHTWLRAQQPRRVWLDSLSRPYQGMYWYHLGLLRGAPLPLVMGLRLPVAAAARGEFAVVDRQHAARLPPALAALPPAYADAYVGIWRLPVAPPMRHP